MSARFNFLKPPSGPLRILIAITSLCFVSLTIYISALRFGFIHDDGPQIVANPLLHSWKNVGRVLLTDVWSQKGERHVGLYYRPLFMIWLLLVRSVGGLDAWIWHLSSLLLSAATTVLAFVLSLAVLNRLMPALMVGLVFALHPIHTESVSWVSAADEPLYSGFFLGSFIFFNQFLDRYDSNRHILWLSALMWVGALFSKETAIALLPIFPLWAYLKADLSLSLRQKFLCILRSGFPFILASGLYLGVRTLVLHRFGTEVARHSWKEVFFTGIDLVRFYALKLLFPAHLSPFYGNPIIDLPSITIWATALLAVAIIALALWFGLRHEPVVALAASLIVLPLLPVLVGVRIFREGDLAHDRYLYLPSVGLCLLIGLSFRYFWSKAADRRWLVASVAGLVLTTLLGLNLTQQRYYHDDEAFYRRGLEIAPNNTLVAGFLGSYYFRQGKFDLGVQQFRHAYEVSPDSPDVAFRFARALFEAGKFDEAEPLLSKLSSDTTITEPRRAILSVALAQTQIRFGKLPEAQATLEPLRATNDNLRELHRTLGTLYEMEGRPYDASHEYEREYQVSGDVQAHRRAIFLAQRRPEAKSSPQAP